MKVKFSQLDFSPRHEAWKKWHYDYFVKTGKIIEEVCGDNEHTLDHVRFKDKLLAVLVIDDTTREHMAISALEYLMIQRKQQKEDFLKKETVFWTKLITSAISTSLALVMLGIIHLPLYLVLITETYLAFFLCGMPFYLELFRLFYNIVYENTCELLTLKIKRYIHNKLRHDRRWA